jgi:PAS domain S-box-containing protein
LQPQHGTAPRRPRGDAPATVPVALLAAALRAQSEGVFIADYRGGAREPRILFANDSFCTLIGRPASQLVGRTVRELHADQADADRFKEWLRTARPGRPLVGDGFFARADGATVYVAWNIDPICAARGRVTHLVATCRDQTERRRLQEALVHAQRLDAVGRLAGGVAHDFNNLLSVINGYCEMLAAHVTANPQALREVAEIHNAGRKAAALIQQLLAFSRRQPFHARVLGLNDLVRSNAEILRRLVGSAGRIDFELAENLANVRTDPAQFQQVLLNLVLNARDALRANGRIVVSTAEREVPPAHNRRATDPLPGRYVALVVSDNGTGMDAETQKHLFEPFFTTKPEGKGTGLGLALVYGVVQQSGGIVSVQSAPSVGSRFEVLLPATGAPVDAPPPSVSPLPSMRGSENVLLVEDDEIVRKMVTGILTADGYKVVSARSFGSVGARDLRPARGMQLLIADLSGEGDKFARRLRRTHPGLRVLCTSHHASSPPLAWLPAERQARIAKPYALGDLLRAVRKLLDAA